ncbi:MAG: glycoside hydrolase family 9 protein [Firmicutes bacterium]|nr:glycoside hydrolase family 9 protein [Bacillota bacterium]
MKLGGVIVKRLLCLLLICLFIVTLMINANVSAATFNYGEALQKAIYFYECQQSGPLPSWNRAKQWRGDSCLNDAVTGGWYDAGDHVKFGLPMANSASMLGWALYQYGPAFTSSGQETAMKNNLQFVLDYFVKCDKGTSLVYQIGDGGTDHSWWGPVEVIEKKMTRPSYTCKGSAVTGQTAAALAIGSIVLNNSTYLTHAKSLFSVADSYKSDADYTAAAGYYQSWSGFWDELIWAAVWLYIATNDSSYLTKAESYVANLNKQGQSTDIEYQYGNSWDDVHYAALLMLAKITGKQQYHDFIKMHLDWWTVGYNGNRITYTPGGLAWLQQWGPLRYAANTALIAFIYADMISDATLKSRYQSFAERQINYCLGQNPGNRSYVVGFGNNPPVHPHHRTAHGSWADSQSIPPNHRHTLYGALVGGPGSNDAYEDVISNYQTNEVACDYNAAFVGCLAKMYSLYGGTPLASFPPVETAPEGEEFFVEAGINASGTNFTEIKALCNNRSGWPARLVKNLSFRYYMDLTELFNAGYTTSNLKISTNYVEFPATITLNQHSGNIYYLNVAFNDGTSIYPGGQSQYAGEIQVRISAPDQTSFWDPTNDPSYKGLPSGGSTVKTANIPVFDGTTKLYGNVPGGATVPPTPTTRSNTPTPTTRVNTPTPTTRQNTPTPTRRSATPTPTRRVTPTPTTRVNTPTPTTRQNTPTPTTSSGGYVVAYVISNDWGTGATINVTITNNTSSAVNGWTLAWTFPGNQTISNLWSGTYTQSGASVSVKDAGYNATIGANGGSVNFGFNINYSGTNAKPTSFTLNGTACTVQ